MIQEHLKDSSVMRLVPMMIFCFIDGNIITQAYSGLISLAKIDVLLMNGLFSVAGVGTWMLAITLPGTRMERVRAASLSSLISFLGPAYSIAILSFLTKFVSDPINIIIIRIFGGLAVVSIGFIVMEIRIPKKTPCILLAIGIVSGLLLSLFNSTSGVEMPKRSIDIVDLTFALYFMTTIGATSTILFAWVGSDAFIKRVIDLSKFVAGIAILMTGFSIVGLPQVPSVIGATGIVVLIAVKKTKIPIALVRTYYRAFFSKLACILEGL